MSVHPPNPRKNIATNYQVRSKALLNGTSVPAPRWGVEVNGYSLSSTIEMEIPMNPVRGFKPLPSIGNLMQKVRPLPIEIDCAYSRDGSGSLLVLESGFVDSCKDHYGESVPYYLINGRGTASIFQDIQVTDPIDRNQGGANLIKSFFGKYNVPLTVTADSPQYAGNTDGDEGDPVYTTTMRDRTVWDEMEAIALADGYRLTVHAGKGVYGPIIGDPTLYYEWQGQSAASGIVDLDIMHSPRRAHNIKVILHSVSPSGKSRTYGSYGVANASSGETFNFTEYGLTNAQCKARAQAIYYDVANREFLANMTIVPDEKFMQTVSQFGSNFSVQLGGRIDPAKQILYQTRQVKFDFNVSRRGDGHPLTASLVMGNLNPMQQGAFLS